MSRCSVRMSGTAQSYSQGLTPALWWPRSFSRSGSRWKRSGICPISVFNSVHLHVRETQYRMTIFLTESRALIAHGGSVVLTELDGFLDRLFFFVIVTRVFRLEWLIRHRLTPCVHLTWQGTR